jgi:hypothetical protein
LWSPSVHHRPVRAEASPGIDITSEYPKPWTDEVVRAADVVIPWAAPPLGSPWDAVQVAATTWQRRVVEQA